MTYGVSSYQEHTERERARAYRSRARAEQLACDPAYRWHPYLDRNAPHPQRQALESEADLTGYGGSAGAGKTDVLLGIAERHYQSIIFRRIFPSLRGIVKRSRELFTGSGETRATDSYNEQLHLWRLRDGQDIEFASMQYEKDKEKFRGHPHDFYGFDELTEFLEEQFRFVIAWNRSTRRDPVTGKMQRCRVVVTFNPPEDESGDWVTALFLPWLACLYPDVFHHPRPAAPGEIRWFIRRNDVDEEVAAERLSWYVETEDGPVPVSSDDPVLVAGEWSAPQQGVEIDGTVFLAKSRTFIPASLKDNPKLLASGYGATIDALPEPLRSLLKGNFAAARIADPWQVIPATWVRAAQQRWRERTAPDVPLQSVGVDPARGGQDDAAIARLFGNWCAEIETYPGISVPDGPTGAALVLPYAEAGVSVGVDVIGIGSSWYDSLIALNVDAIAVNNAESAGDARDRSERFKFRNIRAASYWALREALDPEHGDDLALPDDPELLADLCAPRFKVTTAGIQVEEKDEIKKRIGRSPNKGDALVIAHWVHGQSGWLVWGS